MQKHWHIITGEYAPQPGGVADYCQQVAQGLVDRSDRVTVHTSSDTRQTTETEEAGVRVVRRYAAFSQRGLQSLTNAIRQTESTHVLVQYVPHAFGYKGMNLAFANWVAQIHRHTNSRLGILFHEVAFPPTKWPPHHSLLAAINRRMVRTMLPTTDRIFLSTSAWTDTLLELGADAGRIHVLPIPSNVPAAVSPERIRNARHQIVGDSTTANEFVIGHFGSFGPLVTNLLRPIMFAVGQQLPNARFALIGRNSQAFSETLQAGNANWTNRIFALDGQDEATIASFIAACDCMVQPYADGANTRRTTLMACLINGKATVSNHGPSCEALWQQHSVISLVHSQRPTDFAEAILQLCSNKKLRNGLERTARAYYWQHFAIERTLERLDEWQ